MPVPTWREWLYSAKSLLAALLALYIALAIPLDNPYWAMASVYVVSHPLSGATRSKAIYRALGTLLGAAASVALLPPLAHQPVMLSIATGLWVGLLLFLSLLDRTPRSYIFMLAAYTVPLIALPQVEHPQTVFTVALARSEEILLGIACAALVNTVLFPARIAPVLGTRMQRLLEDGGRWISASLRGELDAVQRQQLLQRLLAEVMALDGLIVQLGHDSTHHLATRQAREFRSRMGLLLPATLALAAPLDRLRQHGALPAEWPPMLAQLDELLAQPSVAAAETLRARSQQIAGLLDIQQDASALDSATALQKLELLLSLWQDCHNLQQALASSQPAAELHYQRLHLGEHSQHLDYPLLGWSAASVGGSVLVACLLWQALGWDYGFSGIFMVAVSGCFFAAQDNPLPFIRLFLRWTLISTLCAGLYLFGVLPLISDFTSLALVLAVPLLVAGTLTGRPQFAIAAMLFAVQTISTLTLQDSYHASFARFADLALSSVLGLVFSLLWTSISRPIGSHWAIARLTRANWQALAALAMTGQEHSARLQLAARSFDRTAQLLPRLGLERDPQALDHACRELCCALYLLELQQPRPPAGLRPLLQPLHAALQQHYQTCLQSGRPLQLPDSLAAQLNTRLEQLRQLPGTPARRLALAVNGLQLHLPHAPASPPHLPPAQELAA